MLDRLAVHVAEPKAAIRRIGKGHGPKPIVPAREKFALLLAGSARRAELDFAAQLLPVN
jgi:hypothetical protein